MTNEKLNVILATALDLAKNDRKKFNNILKHFALAQAFAAEEELSTDEQGIVVAAATLYNISDEDGTAAPKAGDNNFNPIVSPQIIATILEDLYIPTFESSSIRSLVGLQGHGLDIENDLHRILKEIDTLILLDEENADAEKIAASAELFTTKAGKRRFAELFS